MRHDAVDDACGLFLFQMIVREGFLQGTADEAVFGVRNGLFAVLVHGLGDGFSLLVADLQDFFPVGKLAHDAFHTLVVLQ